LLPFGRVIWQKAQAGQGGRNYYRKQRLFIAWAILVALLLGGVLATAMWWIAVRQKL